MRTADPSGNGPARIFPSNPTGHNYAPFACSSLMEFPAPDGALARFVVARSQLWKAHARPALLIPV
jgi:hypothetical protein